jgi:hypothetical protein
METNFIYKMGTNWINKFLDDKKLSQGWSKVTTDDGFILVLKPNNKPFALFDPNTGFVHTNVNIMKVQW